MAEKTEIETIKKEVKLLMNMVEKSCKKLADENESMLQSTTRMSKLVIEFHESQQRLNQSNKARVDSLEKKVNDLQRIFIDESPSGPLENKSGSSERPRDNQSHSSYQ